MNYLENLYHSDIALHVEVLDWKKGLPQNLEKKAVWEVGIHDGDGGYRNFSGVSFRVPLEESQNVLKVYLGTENIDLVNRLLFPDIPGKVLISVAEYEGDKLVSLETDYLFHKDHGVQILNNGLNEHATPEDTLWVKILIHDVISAERVSPNQ